MTMSKRQNWKIEIGQLDKNEKLDKIGQLDKIEKLEKMKKIGQK